MITCTTRPEAAPGGTDLAAYIVHKIGSTLEEIIADSPERFRVMSEVSGTDATIFLGPHTLENPDCQRLVSRHCSLIP